MKTNRIRELRKAMGISQAELADQIGKDQKAISQYERGVATPALMTAYVLAKALGTTIEYMMGWEDDVV